MDEEESYSLMNILSSQEDQFCEVHKSVLKIKIDLINLSWNKYGGVRFELF
jgi:hypothetical protein